MERASKKKQRIKLGPTMQKVLLLLVGGVTLGLSGRPDKYFKILDQLSKEWQKINQRSLHEAIKNLYQSKLIDYKENNDGSVSITLNEGGKKRILQYYPPKITIMKPARWDHFWRLVIFDIPESKKKARDALAAKLKQLGFYPVQKSVFIHPYDCKDEIDFLVEIFELKPYVRFCLVKETDIDLHLKHIFRLS